MDGDALLRHECQTLCLVYPNIAWVLLSEIECILCIRSMVFNISLCIFPPVSISSHVRRGRFWERDTSVSSRLDLGK